MERKKTIALVAHDNMKPDLVEWADWNRELLLCHSLVCTGTTGRMVADVLIGKKGDGKMPARHPAAQVGSPRRRPAVGAMIAEGRIDALIFFWDPMEAQPHDVDVKALLRLATLYNVPTAVNRSTADFMVSSPLFDGDYEPVVKDYRGYVERSLGR